MADEQDSASPASSAPGMFTEPPQEKRFPTTAISIACVAILILVAFLVLLGHRKGGADAPGNVTQAEAGYAPNLPISNIQLSESESLSGGKVTYIDGRIANHGPATVTGVTAQVSFPNDQGAAPQIMTVPLNLIRMREPYIDTQPVSAAPLGPASEADFRLIFEGVNGNWNNQPPAIRLIRVTTK